MAPVASAVKKDCVREIAAALRGAHVPSLVRRAGNVTRTLVARPVPRFVRRPRIERHRARVSRAGSGRGAAFENPPPPAMEAPRMRTNSLGFSCDLMQALARCWMRLNEVGRA